MTATNCGISLNTGIPVSLLYQTTNPATNALTGSPNTPVNIPAGGLQTFLVAFTSQAPFGPVDAALENATQRLNGRSRAKCRQYQRDRCSRFYQRIKAEPQVKPPPIASVSTR